jgi:MFS transporter, ACS family, tartrate transporter
MSERDASDLARVTMRRVRLRLLPFLFVLYIFNFLDRTNIAIAGLQMNRDLHFSSSAFGLGAGVFFIGYSLFEVPSNLLLVRVGARLWIARIMISWGLIAAAMMFVRTPLHFYILRFLLGVAEAGFFPGIVYYLTQWFPTEQRARASARFMAAIPLSGVLSGVFGGMLLGLNGRFGLAGWQWLLLVEGIPSVLLGLFVFAWLTERPEEAQWLTADQRDWLVARLRREHDESRGHRGLPPLRALAQPMVWLLALPYFLVLTAGYGYTFWAPTFIRDTLHTSNIGTGLVVALFACISAAVMLAVGTSSDKHGERCLHASISAGMIAVGYAGAALLPSPIAKVAAFSLVLAGDNSFLVPFWCLPSMLLTGSAAAVGIAFINAVGNIGGFVGPSVIGLARDATGGTTGAFLALAGLGVLAAVVCIALQRQAVFTSRSAPPAIPLELAETSPSA